MSFYGRALRIVVPALALGMLVGCNDQTNKGAGTGSTGAGAAADAADVASPTGGATGTQGTGSTVGAGAGTTNATQANPGSTDAAGTRNPGDMSH